MTQLLTAAQMRAIEQAAIESGAVTGLELMERAGRGVVEAMLDWRPDLALAPHRAVVLCGPGNNGGDGFVVARLLKQRGWEVAVYLYGDQAKLPPDAAENCRRWQEMGAVRPWDDMTLWDYGAHGMLIIDAIFGIGLSREVPSDIRDRLMSVINRTVVAIDTPSALSSDSGCVMGVWIDGASMARLTVTFHQPKIGHYVDHGPASCGALRVADIGLDRGHVPNAVQLTAAPDQRDVLKRRGHKYAFGHALVLSGPAGKTGAARLAARGALRIGAGLVTVACPADALAENAAHLTAIMLAEAGDAAALDAILQDARLNALCLGPGMGRGGRTRALVRSALAANRATVLDADALTSFSGNPAALFERLHENCILTPHTGEFQRLFPDIHGRLGGSGYSRVDATRDAAKRAGCTILLKGPDTVIADQTGQAAINSAHYERAAPWLATAGSGDVLAGFITGLLARGFSPMTAAETAAWLHVECALEFGPGLIAEDLPEQLPAVFRSLGV